MKGEKMIAKKESCRKGGRPSKRPSESVLDAMYRENTAKEIGEMLGVSEATVRRWITNYRKEYASKE